MLNVYETPVQIMLMLKYRQRSEGQHFKDAALSSHGVRRVNEITVYFRDTNTHSRYWK